MAFSNVHILVLEVPILVVSIYEFDISLVLISKLALSVSLNKIVDIVIKIFYYGKKRSTRLHMMYHIEAF